MILEPNCSAGKMGQMGRSMDSRGSWVSESTCELYAEGRRWEAQPCCSTSDMQASVLSGMLSGPCRRFAYGEEIYFNKRGGGVNL